MSNRFRANNARVLVSHLVSTGEDPCARTAAPDTSLYGGCSDPDHCYQHPGTHMGEPMLSVRTHVSNRRLHRLAVELGLI